MRANISRLMGAHPEQLGEGEVGQRGVAGQLDQPLAADLCLQPVALGLGALIAPDQRGTQDFALCVEHDAAVHLAGEADGLRSSRHPVRRRQSRRRWPRARRATSPRAAAPPSRSVRSGSARVHWPPTPPRGPRGPPARPAFPPCLHRFPETSRSHSLFRRSPIPFRLHPKCIRFAGGGCMRAASKYFLAKALRDERQDCEEQLQTENPMDAPTFQHRLKNR